METKETTYTRQDLVNFGTYLLSIEREKRFKENNKHLKKMGQNPLSAKECLRMVWHADVENWIGKQKNEN